MRREYSSAFPQENRRFINCVLGLEEPLETDEDGRAMLDLIFAAYESARTGRKVALPFRPSEGKKPVWLWLRWRETGPRLALHASHQAYGRRIAPLVQAV